MVKKKKLNLSSIDFNEGQLPSPEGQWPELRVRETKPWPYADEK